jgi:hypothetical protein
MISDTPTRALEREAKEQRRKRAGDERRLPV